MKSVTVEFSDSKLATVIVDVVDKSISDSEINQILSLIDVSKKRYVTTNSRYDL